MNSASALVQFLGRDISLERILCVGEATTDSPGSGEDWLLCLVTDDYGTWVEGSMYAAGRNDALQWLSLALGTSMEVKLAHAPPFRSRIMWPPPLREEALFEYQISTLRRLFGRGLRRLGFPPHGSIQTVRPAVLESLRRSRLAV